MGDIFFLIWPKKSFSAFGGVSLTPLNKHKKIQQNVLLNFCHAHEKHILYHFKIVYTINCRYCSTMFCVTAKDCKKTVTNDFFLM